MIYLRADLLGVFNESSARLVIRSLVSWCDVGPLARSEPKQGLTGPVDVCFEEVPPLPPTKSMAPHP